MHHFEVLVAKFVRPAVRAKLTDRPTRSHFGGKAELPRGMTLPEHENPLGLLARVSLTELQAAVPTEWLPKSGALLFFADIGEPEYIDPTNQSAYAVRFVDDLAAPVDARIWKGKSVLPNPRNMEFERVDTIPGLDHRLIEAFEWEFEERMAYIKFFEARQGARARHQIDGYPNVPQNDIEELHCQLAEDGRDLGVLLYDEQRFDAALVSAQRDWRLLFQADTDDELDVMWGDGGTLYFFVREEDARRGDFSRVRASWQG